MYIKSFSYNQEEIIKWILELHCEGGIELDATYSRGVFYKLGLIAQPKFKFDLIAQRPDVIPARAEYLPIKESSIKTAIFDPPFLATSGKSLRDKDDGKNNKMLRRFGWYKTEKDLFNFYIDALKEFKRVLKPGGILIFKCQDKVSSGKQYMSHNFVINAAESLGFYTKDLFVLLAKNRMIPEWQTVNQQHARKFHSYFLVFKNENKSICYT